MKLDLTANEIKAIQTALIAKEISHQKATENYNQEGDKKMGKIHWGQSCYFNDINSKISAQIKSNHFKK